MSAKTVIITGAGSGIGAALAGQYAVRGYNLALLDINEDGAQQTALICRKDGAQVLVQHCDVTALSDCEAAIEATLERFGHIDTVIANAGLTHLSVLEETELSVIRKVMEVNFFGAINIAKAALPALLEAKGQIIVMSSVAGFCPLPMRTGYAASKYAVRGFFETLRTENRHRGLGVMIVCPSYVDTQIGNNALGGTGKKATHQRTEAKGAITAKSAALDIINAAERRRDFITVGKGAALAYFLSRLAPSFLEKLSTKRVMNPSR
jgi:short-subunit dehydrogenase